MAAGEFCDRRWEPRQLKPLGVVAVVHRDARPPYRWAWTVHVRGQKATWHRGYLTYSEARRACRLELRAWVRLLHRGKPVPRRSWRRLWPRIFPN